MDVEFRLIDEEEMPPIVITMDENDSPKVVLNNKHKIWLCLNRNLIAGCAEALHSKLNELLQGHLAEQRAFERMDNDV